MFSCLDREEVSGQSVLPHQVHLISDSAFQVSSISTWSRVPWVSCIDQRKPFPQQNQAAAATAKAAVAQITQMLISGNGKGVLLSATPLLYHDGVHDIRPAGGKCHGILFEQPPANCAALQQGTFSSTGACTPLLDVPALLRRPQIKVGGLFEASFSILSPLHQPSACQALTDG